MQEIQLVECPRDAMQGWPEFIATQQKADYINSLLKVGFDTIDFGSFVSPKVIPQMADTRQLIDKLKVEDTATSLLAIVANLRGAEDAMLYDVIRYVGFPFSISPTFQLRNANSTIEESVIRVEEIQELCLKNNKELVLYLSMGFGNPYGDEYNEGILLHWASEIVKRSVNIISLADTVGLATPIQVGDALHALIPKYPSVNFGVHLHSTAANRQQKIQAALDAGCKRFDGALKGIGGCPMAQDDLVGNMDTLWMMDYFKQKNITITFNQEALQESVLLADKIFGESIH